MSAVVPGRELVAPHLPIYGRGTWLVKAVFLYVRSQKRKLQVAIAVALLGAAAAMQKEVRRLARRTLSPPLQRQLASCAATPAPSAQKDETISAAHQLENTAAVSSASSKDVAVRSTDVIQQKGRSPEKGPRFWELLLPSEAERKGSTLLTAWFSVAALPEALALVAVSLTNAWLLLYKAWLMREFVTGQNLGRWRQWLQALAMFPFATLASAVLSQTTKHLQARVALIWRQTATRKLMGMYFANMNYYKLLNHGSLRIEDPDVRICADVGPAFDALTGVLLTGLSGFTTSLFSGWALYRRRGFGAVLMAYTYALVILPGCLRAVFPDWSVLAVVSAARGAYQQALTRVQLHMESIAMLRGTKFEVSVLEDKAEAFVSAEHRSWKEMARFEWVQHFFTHGAMPGMWQTVASFGAAFIALRAAGPGRPVLDATEANEAVVYEFGSNISDFWQLFYTLRGATTLVGALDTYKRSSVNLKRVEELQRNLRLLSKEEVLRGNGMQDGTSIAFKEVSIATPTGVPLVAQLSFQVDPGKHLLICGHNGAGKSSIFRCLGGLWPHAEGSITLPSSAGRQSSENGAGLHGIAYYLPQRPANVFGTLSDELTYPERVQGGLPAKELRQWLSYVQLGHLVDTAVQNDTLQEEADWGSSLSLGEQQRLGIARVLYHMPRFAILDECTSALSKDMERWLFEVTRELGISCVTIAHRPALQEHHHQMLQLTGSLAEDGRGWRICNLPSDLPPPKPMVSSAEEVHARLRALQGVNLAKSSNSSAAQWLEERSAPYRREMTTGQGAPHAAVLRRWPSSTRRVFAALQLQHVDARTTLHFLALLACMFIRPQLAWEVYRTVAGSVTRNMCSDGVGLFAELFANITYAATLATLERVIEHLARQCQVGVWRCLARALHHDALDDGAVHRLQQIDHPLQRIAGARALVDDLKAQFLTTGGMLIQMCWYIPMLLRGGGALPGFTVVGLYAVHYLVRTRLMPNFKAIVAKGSEYEDRFQVAMTRVRHVAEPVAFSGGGKAEQARVEEQFDRLCSHRIQSLRQEFMYNMLTEFFITYDNLPIWFHRMLSFNFAYRNIPTAGASPASAVQNYLYDRTISVSLVGVQSLAAFSSEWAKLDGKAIRLLELLEALHGESKDDPSLIGAQADAALEGKRQLHSHDSVVVENLALVTPTGDCLAEGLSFKADANAPLLVTGPNGSGKTTLTKALLGLSPLQGSGAKVFVPDRLMIVPQRIYMAHGTLGEQISYPSSFHTERDASRSLQALQAVGLEYLLDRAGEAGWSARCTWEEVLSGGEQQRLALARLFFHRPPIALLDECTSMVAADKEGELYRAAVEDYQIVPITLSQRLFLPQFHKKELRLGDDSKAGWTTQTLSPPQLGTSVPT